MKKQKTVNLQGQWAIRRRLPPDLRVTYDEVVEALSDLARNTCVK